MLKLKVSGVMFDIPLIQCSLPVRAATEIRPVAFSLDPRGQKYRCKIKKTRIISKNVTF